MSHTTKNLSSFESYNPLNLILGTRKKQGLRIWLGEYNDVFNLNCINRVHPENLATIIR